MLGMILTHELTDRHRLIRLRVRINDAPGQMHDVSGIIAEYGANICTVNHTCSDESLNVGEAYLDFLIEASGESQAAEITQAIRQDGYDIKRIN